MSNHACPLDVLQELNPQPMSQVRAFDQPRNIGHNKAMVVIRAYHSEPRLQSREGIVGDLRPRRRDPGDQRRFTSVRETRQPHVGEKFQLQPQTVFLAWESGFMLRRRLMRRSGEASVSLPATPAASHHKTVAGLSEIVKHLAGLGVVNDRADGCGYVHRVAVAPFFIATLAVTSALGFVLRIEAEVKKSVVVLAGHQSYVAAAAAVASARTTSGDVFLAAKRQTTVAAVAGFNLNRNFVYEQVAILLGCHDADEFAQPAPVSKFDYAGDFGKQSVVLAEPDVDAGFDAGAALAHDDGAAGNKLAAEGLDPKALRIRIAPVFRTA